MCPCQNHKKLKTKAKTYPADLKKNKKIKTQHEQNIYKNYFQVRKEVSFQFYRNFTKIFSKKFFLTNLESFEKTCKKFSRNFL
jgi:hypothetical protein